MEKINLRLLKFVFFTIILSSKTILTAQVFHDVSISKGINTYAGYLDASVAVIDFDNDGWEDILFTSGYSNDTKGYTKLYKNINGTTFQDVTQSSGLDTINKLMLNTMGVSVGDIDNDGDEDIIFSTFFGVSGTSGHPLLFENLGNGTFRELKNSFDNNAFNWGESVSFGDINLDGYLDVYFSNLQKNITSLYDTAGNINGYIPEGLPNQLYINNKNNTFTNVSTAYNCQNNGVTWVSYFSDYDNDRDVDLIIGNDFGMWNGLYGIKPNALFKNNYPAIPLEDISLTTGMNPKLYCMGLAVGDYDNDLDLDYYFTSIGKNNLMQQQPNHSFIDVVNVAGVADSVDSPNGLKKTNWGCMFLDIDNDEDLDLYVNSGWVSITYPNTITFDSNRIFTNNANNTFTDITNTSGLGSVLSHKGCAQFDYNHDGKIDIVSAVSFTSFPSTPPETQHSFLYQNDATNANHYLNVKLQGIKCNRDAYGSKVIIYYGNKHQMREVGGGGDAHGSISSPIQHFGLGINTLIDSVQVIWLGGNIQTIYNITSNQTLKIIQDTTASFTTGLTKNKNTDFKIFPTIISNLSEIKMNNNPDIKNIQIINPDGTIIYNSDDFTGKNTGSFFNSFNSDLLMNNGLYLIRIIDKNYEVFLKKIIISKN